MERLGKTGTITKQPPYNGERRRRRKKVGRRVREKDERLEELEGEKEEEERLETDEGA